MNPKREFQRRIERLRARLRDETDLGKLHAQFHDELAFLPALHRESEPRRNAAIEQCLAAALARLDPQEKRCMAMTLYVPSVDLWHGQVTTSGMLGTFFGFEGASQLCLGVLDAEGMSHFIRATFAPIPKDARAPGMPFAMRSRGTA